MSDELRNALQAHRDTLVVRGARELLEGATTQVETFEELDRVSRVLDALPPPPPRRTIPIVIGLASILIVALSWLIPINVVGVRSTFQLEATSLAVSLTPSEDLEWSPDTALAANEIRLTAESLSGWSSVPDTAQMVKLVGGDIDLDRIHVPELGQLGFARTGSGALEIAAGGQIAVAELLVSGAGTIDDIGFSHPVPERLRLETGSSGRPPITLTASPTVPFYLRGLPVSAVRFGVPNADGGFASSLQSATLRLPQIDQEYELLVEDALLTEGLEARVIELRVDPEVEGLRLVAAGTVRSVSLEQGGTVRSATPTILDYTFENQRLAFLLGALSAIWGLLWSALRLFLS